MTHFIDTLLSSIAPHDCVACGTTGDLLCQDCILLLPETISRCYRCSKATASYQTCATCRSVSPLNAVYICTDYETVAKALVQKLKFERAYASADTIAKALVLQFGDTLPRNTVITHIPTATSRVRERGYDQARLIAKHTARHMNMQYVSMLWRLGQQRQTNSTRGQRLMQLQDAFTVRPGAKRLDHVILVDDVMTTGATLESAAKTLKAAGVPKVSALVFARAT